MKRCLLVLADVLWFASLFAGQHVTVTCEHTNAVYAVDEEATFTVAVKDANGALMPTGAVTVVLDNIGSKLFVSNRMDLAKGNPFKLSGRLSEPGFLRLKVISPEIANPTPYNKDVVIFTCAVDPFKFVQRYACPTDFDAFWSAARAQLAKEVPLDPQIALDPTHANDADFVWYHVSFATFGRRVYGYMVVPKGVPSGTRLPVRVQVPGAGFGAWSNIPDTRKGYISFFLSVFPWQQETDFEQNRAKYRRMNDDYRARKLNVGTKPDTTCYHVSGIARSREDYFYYPVILGMDRAIDWLAQRPEVDPKRITYHGTSQGGAFGLFLMGLNRTFARGVVYVPALTGQHLREQGLEDTWPWFADEGRANAAYFDTVNFAARVRCPIRFAVGLSDTLCPPTGVLAAYNACPSPDKDIILGIGMSHTVYKWIYQRLGDWEVGARPTFSVVRVEKEPCRADFQQIRVSTGERMACCDVGEKMMLKVDVIGTNGQRVVGLPITWKRRGDDGRTEEGTLVSASEPVEVAVSMTCPGEIRFDFSVGEPKPAIKTKDFSGGVMVAPEKIRASAAPADLEAFWAKERAELAKVPMRVLEEKIVFSNAAWRVYDMKIACAGKRPVSGYLTIPNKASPKSLPVAVYFYGYSVGSAERHFDPKAITFGVNTHGIENGREEAYYSALGNGELAGYALNRIEKPEDSYFLGMCLRALRAIAYMKTRPEWDGKTLLVAGHSQGGYQALMAASLDPDVTRVEANEPWMCNVGSAQRGGLAGFDPAYSPALEYFDPAHLLKQTRAEIDLIAGLCDDTCPAGRIAAVWNAAPGRCRIAFYQAKNHFWEIDWTSAFALESFVD